MLVAAAACSVAGTLLAGCGGGTVGYSEGTGDRGRGKELFTQACGSCHTLQDAGTTGQIGPNLDYAFLQSRRDGLGQDTITQVVRGQIAYPVTDTGTGGPGMPADLVTGQDAEDVASYVAAVAGIGVADTTPAPAVTEPVAPAPEPAPPAKGDPAAGKQVFATSGCGSCHTLADAATTGTVGPNLDESKPTATLVRTRVTNGKGTMPSFRERLSAQQLEDVVAYVSSAAGN
jgi:mono/diheme cytochrome c family protein